MPGRGSSAPLLSAPLAAAAPPPAPLPHFVGSAERSGAPAPAPSPAGREENSGQGKGLLGRDGVSPLMVVPPPQNQPRRIAERCPPVHPRSPGRCRPALGQAGSEVPPGLPGHDGGCCSFSPGWPCPQEALGGCVCVCPCRCARLLPLRYSHTCSHLARAGHPRRSPRRAPSMLPSSSCCCCCLTFLQVTRLSVVTLGVFFPGGSAGFSISVAGSG